MAYVLVKVFLLSSCLVAVWAGYGSGSNLQVVNQWSAPEFVFPSEAAKQRAIDKEFYIKGESVLIDVDKHSKYVKNKIVSRTFVTNPRFGKGRPVTLGTVDDNGLIRGYPDYTWHDNQGTNCDGMTSVFRVAIDKCDRLWVLDAGKIGDDQVCPPQFLAFDLNTDKLIYRHKVNASNYVDTSLLITPVVDVRNDDCSNTFVYAADVTGFAIVVYQPNRNLSWTYRKSQMYAFPSRSTFTIQGESFELMDGVFGMALSPYKPGQDRLLYFHALAATTENVVRTSVLRNISLSNPSDGRSSVYVFPEERPNQSAAQAMDSNGVLYFGLMDPPCVLCWNSATQFSNRNFYTIAENKDTLQFTSGMKIVKNINNEEELYVLSCRFQKVMTGTISSNETNFRILTGKISTLLKNTGCSSPYKG